MFTTTTPFALVFSSLALLLVGCETSSFPSAPEAMDVSRSAPPSRAHSVPLSDALEGDFYYRLTPLADRDVFQARLEFQDEGTAELRTTKLGDRSALALVLSGLAADSVTIDYLANGTHVAASLTYRMASGGPAFGDGAPCEAGAAGDEPDSYHYIERDGRLILVKDYNEGEDLRGGVSAGTPFTTTRGEHVRVTHVSFTVHGAKPGTPTALQFSSPRAFDLLASRVQG